MFDYRFIRFLIVGLANTAIGLLIIYACKWLFEMGDVISNIIGYAAGMIIGFMLNKNWTFEHRGRHATAFLRFLAVLASAYLINLITVLYAIDGLRLNSYLAQALGIIPYTLMNYIGSRYFVFKEPHGVT